MNTEFFSDLLSSIAERGRQLLGRREWPAGSVEGAAAGLIELCENLLSGRGEASGIALAQEVLDGYERLDTEAKASFFAALEQRFGPQQERLQKAIDVWRNDPSEVNAAELHFEGEPRRQELFRRLNRAPGGTAALVRMRADLLDLAPAHPMLRIVDRCLRHLLSSWFNRGFLVLRRIDWSTPASVLEKIMRYEAVHAIHGWDDLRSRISPADRRCYAFFHPALVDEPLIFVEVALAETMPAAIAPLLAATRAIAPLDKARTAIFYSISNCQHGLDGISFGNFLIKQVVEDLRHELPRLDTFVTLSPVPGFMQWLKARPPAAEEPALVEMLSSPEWAADPDQAERLRKPVETLAADYFLNGKTSSGRVADSVARFHLGNGARLERINWLGDTSDKALREGAGLMVNYLYDLDAIEANHEAYANKGVVATAPGVRRLLRGTSRPLLQLPVGSSN